MNYALTLLLPISAATLALVWQIHMAEKDQKNKKDKNGFSKGEKEKINHPSWPASEIKPEVHKEGLNVSNGITKDGKPFLHLFKLLAPLKLTVLTS